MSSISEMQMKTLGVISKEAGVMSWDCGWVLNPTEPRSDWDWRFGKSRHETDRHHGGAAELLRKLRKENLLSHDVYFRPAQGANEDSIIAYRYFALDDVPVPLARQIAAQNRALVVQTSAEGGCQVWVFTAELLTRRDRLRVQQHMQKKIGSDEGAVSGVQFSRMPSFKNHKRGGQWVNVLCWPTGDRLSVANLLNQTVNQTINLHGGVSVFALSAFPVGGVKPPSPVSMDAADMGKKLEAAIEKHSSAGNQSVVDWRACAELIRAGADQDQLIDALSALSTRKGRHAHAYARRTVENLMLKT